MPVHFMKLSVALNSALESVNIDAFSNILGGGGRDSAVSALKSVRRTDRKKRVIRSVAESNGSKIGHYQRGTNAKLNVFFRSVG
jgi:hypothetical protein